MMAARYKLLFRGKSLAGQDQDKLKHKLGELLKLDQQGLAQLFSGRLITLKRGLLQQEASKYQQVLENLGAEILLQPDNEQAPVSSEAAVASAGEIVAPIVSATGDKAQALPLEQLTCPRCGHSQGQVEQCGHCKMDLRLHIMRLQRKAKAQQARRGADTQIATG